MRGHDVRLLTFYAGGAGADEARAKGLAVVSLDKRGRWDILRFGARLARVLRERHPDVAYAMLPAANVAAALARPWCRGIALVMGVRTSRMALRHYDIVTRATYALEAWLARGADAVIANSEAGRQACLARGFPAARLHVVANGIDVSRFRPDPSARTAWRARLGIAADAPVIGMVARYDPMKAHRTFLEAAARLRVVLREARFILAGDGVDAGNATLVHAVARRGLSEAVALVGERTDIESLFPSFDIATLSSAFGEGFPNVLGEAMAAGVPCVATDVGDCRAIVGDSGLIVAPGDPDALASAWGDLLSLEPAKRAALGATAREIVAARYGTARLAEETEAVLRQAVS